MYKITSQQVGSDDSTERIEIDNLETMVEALYFLDCKREIEQVKPGIKIEVNGEPSSFKVLSDEGQKGIIFKVKNK